MTGAKGDQVHIRRFEEKDKAGLIELFDKVFGAEAGRYTSDEDWEWLSGVSPYEPVYRFIGADDEAVVSHYAAMPVRIKAGRQEIKAQLASSIVTDKRYRRLGLFSNLFKVSVSKARDDDYVFSYGFPNKNSIALGVKQLGWTVVSSLPVLVKISRPVNALGKKIKHSCSGPLAVKADTLFADVTRGMMPKAAPVRLDPFVGLDKGFDDLWEKAKDQFPIACVRKACYLNWRYVLKPDNRYIRLKAVLNKETTGYGVGFSEDRYGLTIGYIMDVLTSGKQTALFHFIMQSLEDELQSRGVDIISALCNPSDPYYRLFLRRGYFPLPERFLPHQAFFVCLVPDDNPEKPFLCSAKNWHLTWGDTDVV